MEEESKTTSLIDLGFITRNHSDTLRQAQAEVAGHLNDASVTVIPKGFEIKDLSCYTPFRNQFEAHFDTHLIPDFAKYCGTNAEDAASDIYIDEERMQAVRIFDMGGPISPGHCNHTANLQLKKTPAYSWLQQTMGPGSNPVFDQLALVNMIQDWRDHITLVGGNGHTINLLAGLNAIRSINIDAKLDQSSTVSNMAQSTSVMEQIEVAARGDNALPAGFKFKCVPYYGLAQVEFDIQIAAHLEKEKAPKLKLRIMARDVMEEKIAEDFLVKVGKALKDETVVMGVLRTGPDYGRQR